QKVGSIAPNIPSASTSQSYFEKAAKTCGWKWIYDPREPAAQTSFYSDVQAMKAKGVKLVFISAENAQNAATLKQEADSQGFKPIWIIPIAYASDFISRLVAAGDKPSDANGIVGSNLYSMFFSPDDARNIPEVALFQKWMHLSHPNDAVELYAMYSWAAAKMFVQVLKQIGPKVTRAAFTDAIRKITSFNANGMLPTTDPIHKKPANCYVLWEVRNGGYYRVDTPANKFRCDGTFVYL
ncbi:MAG: ABC transporter substrate-binding protein, partial [Geminicoccaceae bacterium]